MKTRQDNNVTDRIDVVYDKKKIELSWLIKPSEVRDKNQIG